MLVTRWLRLGTSDFSPYANVFDCSVGKEEIQKAAIMEVVLHSVNRSGLFKKCEAGNS